MTTNDSKLLEKVLSKWAIHQYNPETKISDFKDWDNLRRVYVKRTGWNIYLADISNVAKIAIDLARLAALDDCKTLLEGMTDYQRSSAEVAIERLREEYKKAEVYVPESDIGWKAFGRKALAELEALRKKGSKVD